MYTFQKTEKKQMPFSYYYTAHIAGITYLKFLRRRRSNLLK